MHGVGGNNSVAEPANRVAPLGARGYARAEHRAENWLTRVPSPLAQRLLPGWDRDDPANHTACRPVGCLASDMVDPASGPRRLYHTDAPARRSAGARGG